MDDNGPHIQTRSASDPVAELTLSLPKRQFYEGEKVVAQFDLRNRASYPLFVNKRLGFNDKTVPPKLRETWIDLKSLDGGRVQPDCVGGSFPAHDTDYATLPAGGEISSRDDVTCLNMSAGRYLLVAHYRDANEHPPYAPAGTVPFASELWSEPITVEILKNDGLD